MPWQMPMHPVSLVYSNNIQSEKARPDWLEIFTARKRLVLSSLLFPWDTKSRREVLRCSCFGKPVPSNACKLYVLCTCGKSSYSLSVSSFHTLAKLTEHDEGFGFVYALLPHVIARGLEKILPISKMKSYCRYSICSLSLVSEARNFRCTRVR